MNGADHETASATEIPSSLSPALQMNFPVYHVATKTQWKCAEAKHFGQKSPRGFTPDAQIEPSSTCS